MSIEIQVQTNEAQSNVEALDTKVVGLMGSLKDAYKEAQTLNSSFSFSSAAIAEIQKVREEFESLRSTMQSLRAEVADSASSMGQYANSSSSVVQNAQNQSRAVLGVVESLKQQSTNAAAAVKANTDLSTSAATATQIAKQEAAAQTELAAAMKRLETIIRDQLSPLEVYKQRLNDLHTAQQAFVASNGTAGISSTQFANGMRSAHDELRNGLTATTAAKTGISGLSKEMGLANQGAAAFRATLEGSGLGFGIFTGQTILAATAAFGFATALKGTLEVGAEFQQALVRGAVLAGDYVVSINASGNSLTTITGKSKLLRDEYQDLATQTRFSAIEFAEAGAKMEQAGAKAVDVYNAIKSVSDLATISNTSLVESASNLVTVSHLFGLSFEDSARTASILALAATNARTSVEEVTHGLVTVGPIAKEAGLGLADVSAALTTLAKGGFEDKAGAGLRAVFSAIGKETPVATKALASLGLSFKDFYDKDGLNFVKTIEKIKGALEDKSIETRMNILNALFRSQGSATGSFLMQNVESLKALTEEMHKASDQAERLANAMNNTVQVAFKELGNELNNIKENAFSGFETELYNSIKQFTEYLRVNGPEISAEFASIAQSLLSFTEFIVSHGAAILKLIEVYATYKVLVIGMSSVAGVYEALATKITAFKDAAISAAVAEKALAEATILQQESAMFAANNMGKLSTVAKEAAVGVGTLTVAETAAATASIGFAEYATAAVAALGGWPIIIAAAVAGLLIFGVGLGANVKSMEELRSESEKAKRGMEDLRDIWESLGKLNAQGLRQSGHSLLDQLGLDESGLKDAEAKLNHLQQRMAELTANPLKLEQRAGMIAQTKSDLDEAALAVENFKKNIAELNQKQGDWTAASFAQSAAVKSLLGPLIQSKEASSEFIAIVKDIGVKAGATDLALAKLPLTLRLIATGMKTAGADMAGFLQQLSTIIAKAQAPQQDNGKALADAKEAESRAKQLAQEMRSIVQAYDKQVPSSEAVLHNLTEIESVTAAFHERTKAVTAELSKMGYTSSQVQAALNWKAESTTFNEIRAQLILLNPAYKDLNFSHEDGSKKAGDHNAALKTIDTTIAMLKAHIPGMGDAFDKVSTELKAGLTDAENGTAGLDRKFQELARSAPVAFGKLFEGKEGVNALAEAYGRTGDKLNDLAQKTFAYATATSLLGPFLKQAATEQEKLAAAQQAGNILVEAGKLSVEQLARAMELYKESLPTGHIEKANQNLQNQITLMKAGVTDLTAYNLLWSATKGHLEDATQGMIDAANAQAKLNDTMQQVKQVQQIYKGFADSLGNVFRNVLDGTDNSFKKFFKDIKSQFENLLLDMVTAAIKQQIMFAFGFAPQGAGTMVGAMQSGGSSILSSLGSFFGGGQQQVAPPAPASGANLNLGALVSQAIGQNLGYDTSGGTGGGSFGGSNVLSLISTGKSAFGWFTGGGAAGAGTGAAATGGGFDYFGSLFGGGAGSGAAGAGQFIGQAGGINLASSAGAGSGASAFAGSQAGATASGGIQFMPLVGGVIAGVNEFKAAGGGVGGAAGAAAYGVGTYAAGVAISTAMTGGIAAGMAAIPVVGWIALAAMAINMISGGKLFGTAWKPTGSATTIDIGASSGTMSSQTFETRQKAFFGGTARKTIDNKVDAASQAQAEAMFKEIQASALQAQQTLGVSMVDIVSGSFKTLYDKKGKLTDQFSTVLGVVYHESIDDFKARLKGESIVAAVGASLASMGLAASEAGTIAQQYRANANMLLDAANTMVAAQLDIKNGHGLLQESGAGVLTKTMDIVSKLNHPGEALADTYTRLVASTQLLTNIYSGLDVATGKTREKFIEFSATVVDMLGGVQAAQAAWQQFSASVYTFAQQLSKPVANNNLALTFGKIGVDPTTSLSDFAAQFAKNLPQLTAQQLADWVKAGAALGTINNAMMQMDALSKGVDLSSVLNQQAAVVGQMNALIKAAADAGASQEQLAKLEEEAVKVIGAQLVSFMQPIEQELAKLNGREYTYQLQQIKDTMDHNIITATALGASEKDLSDIRQLAAYQTAQAIASLQAALGSAVTKLYGSVVAVGTAATQSASNLVVVTQQQVNLYNANLARYNAELQAIQTITDYVKSSLVGALSPLDWQGQLNTAQSQFASQAQLAKGGDANAISSITQFAQTYLQQAQSAYGNSAQYGQIFKYVMDMLNSLKGQFVSDTAGGSPNNPGAVGSGGQSASSASTSTGLDAPARYQLALQIAQQIGQLGLALNASVWDLLKQYGITTQQLTSDFGIDIAKMDDNTVSNLKILNSALGTKMTDLLSQLKVTPDQIGNYFKITAASLNAGNLKGLNDLGKFLGTSVFDTMKFLGTDIKTVVKGLGLDITKLDHDSVDNLIKIAGLLGVKSADLIEALGISMAQLATSFGINITGFDASMIEALNTLAAKFGLNMVDLAVAIGVDMATFSASLVTSINTGLAAIPNLPADFTTGLSPFLTELSNAKTPADVKQAYADINNYLSNLAPDLTALITPLFTSLGFNIIKGDGGVKTVKDAVDTGNTTLGTINGTMKDGFAGIHDPIHVLPQAITTSGNLVVDAINRLGGAITGAGINVASKSTSALSASMSSSTSTQMSNNVASSVAQQLFAISQKTASTTATTTTAAAVDTAKAMNAMAAKITSLEATIKAIGKAQIDAQADTSQAIADQTRAQKLNAQKNKV